MRSARPILLLAALLAPALVAACDDQSSLGNIVRSEAGNRVDRVKRGAERISDRLRNRRGSSSRREGRDRQRGGRSKGGLWPHRGDYAIEVSGYSSARYQNATGTLTIDVIDDCNDWTLQEKLDIVLLDQDKKPYGSNLLYRATEKASADRFIFAYSRDHLGERDDYIGDARPVPDGFLASFIEPKITDLMLPKDAVFPISHFRQVLANARRSRGKSETVVFDGGNAIAYQAITEIGRPLRSDDDNPRVVAAREMLERDTSDRLPAGKTWPVTISYYPLDDPYAAPVFTRDLLLHETGIIVGLHFDYGDLQMDASLVNLDIFEPARCAQEKRR